MARATWSKEVSELAAQIEGLQSSLASLGRQFKGDAESAGTSIGSGVSDWIDQASGLLSSARRNGSHLAQDARVRGSDAYRAVGDTVGGHPVSAVIAAVGVGFMLGWLSRGGR